MKLKRLVEDSELNEDRWYDARFIDSNGKRIRKYAYLSDNPATAHTQLDRILAGHNSKDYKYAGEFSTKKNRDNIPRGATLIGLHPTVSTAAPTTAMIKAGDAITDATSGMRDDSHKYINSTTWGSTLGDYYVHHIDGNENNNATNNLAIIPMNSGTITYSQENSGFVHWALHLFRDRLGKSPKPKYVDFYLVDTGGGLIKKQLKLEII